jgi:hypothetical protein
VFAFDICIICTNLSILVLENEIDGKTLLKLSEAMVARLLPTMKLQVKFLELQKSQLVQQPEHPGVQAAVLTSPPGRYADRDLARPSPSEQNGFVMLLNNTYSL